MGTIKKKKIHTASWCKGHKHVKHQCECSLFLQALVHHHLISKRYGFWKADSARTTSKLSCHLSASSIPSPHFFFLTLPKISYRLPDSDRPTGKQQMRCCADSSEGSCSIDIWEQIMQRNRWSGCRYILRSCSRNVKTLDSLSQTRILRMRKECVRKKKKISK